MHVPVSPSACRQGETPDILSGYAHASVHDVTVVTAGAIHRDVRFCTRLVIFSEVFEGSATAKPIRAVSDLIVEEQVAEPRQLGMQLQDEEADKEGGDGPHGAVDDIRAGQALLWFPGNARHCERLLAADRTLGRRRALDIGIAVMGRGLPAMAAGPVEDFGRHRLGLGSLHGDEVARDD